MELMDVVVLIVSWVIMIFLVCREYKKLNEEEKNELKEAFKQPWFYVEVVLRYVGLVIFFSGSIVHIPLLHHIGVVMVITSLFAVGVNVWEESIKRSVYLILLSSTIGLAYYFISI
ncbi:hypothetical protein FZW96_07310 [Bacillus sp. BGMRC 2118]|nr:hypothetical protein FZW96_07310 [Bacillus sp. BGMRC 2118]